MYSLNDTTLESNKQFRINFNGGDLSSDAGLLLIAVLGKSVLASQPTLSRFFNRMDEDTLRQFYKLTRKMRKQTVDTIQLKLLKIAARVVHSARYITFKLCSSYPYQPEFYETLTNIRMLHPKLEQYLTLNLDNFKMHLCYPWVKSILFLGQCNHFDVPIVQKLNKRIIF